MLTIMFSLGQIIGFVAVLVFFTQILQYRLKVWQAAVIVVVTAIPAAIRVNIEPGGLVLVLAIGGTLVSYAAIMLMYKGKWWHKLLTISYFTAVMFLSEALVLHFFGSILNYAEFEYISVEGITMSVLASIVIILLGSLSVFIWRAISIRKFRLYYVLFFIFPISQVATIQGYQHRELAALWLSGILISMIANLILLVYIVSLEKKTAVEEELRETRHAMELEQSHYRGAEQRREELSKIRHDFNNQLAVIGRLVRSGEQGTAQEMITALSKDIIETDENLYCNTPVINAVLAEKAQDCEEAGINMDVDLELPAALTIEPIHLCSIYGNLLDNAINACKKAARTDAPTIQLKSMVDGSYLFIKVTNPADEPNKKQEPGRGYGTRILSDFAVKYKGDYRTEHKDGVFSAVVSLLAVGEPEAVK
jgi:signal transduction histidine kinase